MGVPTMSKFAVILPAAGKSSRFHDKRKKPFADLDGRAIWVRSAELFINREDVCQTIVVIAADDRDEFQRRFAPNLAFMGVEVVEGGAERCDSVAKALERVGDAADFVAIHDAVRPCLLKEDIDKVFAAAEKSGAAVLATRINDTIKRANDDGTVAETVARDKIWTVQTPQVFRRELLLKAYANRSRAGKSITDDSQLVEATGTPVTLVSGPVTNIKVTTKQDVVLARAVLGAMPKPKVQGPLHPFAEDKMW
jgi:2-C-methyl-D-erythritol 4-phosphate cytidylyltransferase